MAFVYWIHKPEHTDLFSQGYVGITSSTVGGRWAEHSYEARKGTSTPLYNSIRKNGNLIVDTVLEGSLEYCLGIERSLRPLPNTGYNIAVGGGACMAGRKHSEDAIQKMREVKSGESHPQFGVPRSDETKGAIAKANTGKRHSKETIAKLSGDNHWLKAAGWSEEHKKAVSEKLKGRAKSAEHKAALAAFTANTMPWEYAVANKLVWSYAMEVFSNGFTATEAATAYKLTRGSFEKMFKRFKQGWNPLEDSKYMAWLAEYQTNKECYGT